jgi:oxygen-independent coproporphyrinogen-3 oxidase
LENRRDNLQPVDSPAGLYIHIPFCLRKCPYCDFYSITDRALISAYLDALKEEMRIVSGGDLLFDTIYIGGGTPTLLSPGNIAAVLDQAHRMFAVTADAEITIEANPGTVNMVELKAYHRVGIGRINIGVQSFDPQILAFLGRIHSADEALRAVRDARRAGFENLGIDLIYGIPDQDEALWRRDLDMAVSLSPDHLSCYMLSYEDGTPLAGDLQKKRFAPLPDETTAGQFETAHEFLTGAGYEHYEISNFAKRSPAGGLPAFGSFRSRHNVKYWTFVPYIGLGPSAHSYDGCRRHWNYSDVNRYIACLKKGKPPIQAAETLTKSQQIMEAVYLGLRTVEGIDMPRFKKKFGIAFEKLFSAALPDIISHGWVSLSKTRCALTTRGMLLLDSVSAKLIDAV